MFYYTFWHLSRFDFTVLHTSLRRLHPARGVVSWYHRSRCTIMYSKVDVGKLYKSIHQIKIVINITHTVVVGFYDTFYHLRSSTSLPT